MASWLTSLVWPDPQWPSRHPHGLSRAPEDIDTSVGFFVQEEEAANSHFAAKAKGVYKGRPATFDRARIVALRKEGMGATEIAKAVGCKRGNVYKTLKAAGLN